MSTAIHVTPIPPGPEITQANTRQLNAALKLHYHILRHADDQVHDEIKRLLTGEKTQEKTLLRLIRQRDKAQEIFLLYIQEANSRRI